MAQISHYGVVAHLRSDASHHVIRYRAGRKVASGPGLAFWFRPETASIAELPMDDREMALFVEGRSADFQQVAVQGVLSWRVAEPERLAARVDFSIDLRRGTYRQSPIERIETRLTGLVNQAVMQHMADLPVEALLEGGTDPMRRRLEAALTGDGPLAETGLAVVSVRLSNLAPTSELQRALQTPVFESLQQRADEAMFGRRALAVEKERAIAENELASQIELARRTKTLIAEEAENERDRAQGRAAARQIEAEAEAARIRAVETAHAETEEARIAIYRDLSPGVLLGLAGRELAGKMERIEHLNVSPDLLAALLREVRASGLREAG